MSDSFSSSPHQPDRSSTIGYARDAIDSKLSLVQKQAEALEVESISDFRSLRALGDAVYALLTATDVFGPWLAGRTLPSVQNRLDKASRWGVGLLELQAFEAELDSDESCKIDSIHRVRDRIENQVRRGKAKLSLATKELARARFRDDVTDLTTALRWSGNGNEPGVDRVGARTISDVKNDFLLTVSEGVPHFTMLHLLLLQVRRLRSVMELFHGELDRETSGRIQQDLTRLYDELEPAALASAVMIMGTRMMGSSTDEVEALALREFVPVATTRVDTLFEQLRNMWSRELISRLENDFSSLLSHYSEFASRDRATD